MKGAKGSGGLGGRGLELAPGLEVAEDQEMEYSES